MIAVIAVIAGIAVVAASRARARAKESFCAANLSQIHQAAMLYSADYDDRLPQIMLHLDIPAMRDDGKNGKRYKALLTSYGVAEPQFFCPLDPITNPHRAKIGIPLQPPGNINSMGRVDASYINSFRFFLFTPRGQSVILSSIPSPSDEIHLCDAPSGVNESTNPVRAITGHGERGNAVFFDGHVRLMP